VPSRVRNRRHDLGSDSILLDIIRISLNLSRKGLTRILGRIPTPWFAPRLSHQTWRRPARSRSELQLWNPCVHNYLVAAAEIVAQPLLCGAYLCSVIRRKICSGLP